MGQIETRQFGILNYDTSQIITFAAGLPGFEMCREFLLHEEPAMGPFLFLQSLSDPNLSFVTLPAERLEETYELALSRDDLAQLGLTALPEPGDVLCLAILQLQTQGANANLAAPIVIVKSSHLGTQAVRQDRRYRTNQPVVWGARQGGE